MKQKLGLITILLTLLLSACNSSHEEEFLRYIKRVKNRQIIDYADKTQCIKEKPFRYPSHQHRKSPFKKKMTQSSVKQSQLANSNAESLQFVGLLKSKTNKWALFAHKNGEIMYSKLNDELGIEHGKIIKIEESSLTLEKMILMKGKWQKNVIQYKLNLPK